MMPARFRSRDNEGQRGQGLVELALIVPIIIALFVSTAELGLIDAPTLIVWGDQDTIFFESDQQALDAGIPDSTLLVYEGIGHGVHWEEPARFVDDLVDFI